MAHILRKIPRGLPGYVGEAQATEYFDRWQAMQLCQFYGWTPADVEAMSLRDYDDALTYMHQYFAAQNERVVPQRKH